MRDTKHLTTGTPKDKMNVDPIWSADNKWIAYTQHQAKGTDSNIFVAEVATGKSTLITPHQGEAQYTANDFSPDGKHLLITSNAGNGYDNVGMLDIAQQEDRLAYAGQMGDRRRAFLSRRQVGHVDCQCGRQHRNLPARSRFRKDHFPAAAQRRKPSGRRRICFHPRRLTPALLPQWSDVAQRCLGLLRSRWQIAADHEFAGGWRALRGHGRTVSGALSQPRRQVDHLRLRVRALQHGAQRAERRRGLCSRRADFADHEFFQPHHPAHGQPGLHGDRAQLSRIHRIRQRISAGQPVRHGRRRFAGCARRRRT